MRTSQPGFALVEFLVVTVIAAAALAAVYETLLVQERTYRAGGALIHDQEALRTAIGILESELREVGTIGGSDIGGSDVAVATPDSVVFRAQRKIGFICELSRSERWVIAHSLSDPFAAGDELLMFVDGDSLSYKDDQWASAAVSAVAPANSAACQARWPAAPLQKLQVTGNDLTGVRQGSPLRSFEWMTYGLYRFGHLGWGLGRHGDDQSPTYLVGGLAAPGEGLSLQYFDIDGQPTAVGSRVAGMRIGLRTHPVGSAAEPAELSTTLFLRNN